MFSKRLSAKCALAFLSLAAIPAIAGNSGNYNYLALGESIAFGMDLNVLLGPMPMPGKFRGYPEVVADVKHLTQSKKIVNAACPGETSASFLVTPFDSGIADNGCNSFHFKPDLPAFKTLVGLHVNYFGSQMRFAESELVNNKHIDLVTLSLGGNDLLLLQARCSTDPRGFALCVQQDAGSVLAQFGANLGQIVARIRAVYKGNLVLMTLYSPSADPLYTFVVSQLNNAINQVATLAGAKVADGFLAFQIASAPFKGDPCKAGLLIQVPLNSGNCDVHPSALGQDLLATTVFVVASGK